MSGDANMSAYGRTGTRQQSSSLKHSCWHDMVRYFVRGYNDAMSHGPNCRVIPRFMSSNPLSSLRWWEDAFGQEFESCRAVNWDTVPNLDCLVSCILEWAHTFTDDKWAQALPGLEYKVQVSEWLLHSSKDDYLFSPSDKDSHVPLLIHILPRHFGGADLRATQRPESKMDRNARRKERQKLALHHLLPEELHREERVHRLLHLRRPVEQQHLRLRQSQRLPLTRASPKPKARGKPLLTRARASPSQKVTLTARRARRGTPTTARAKARSERGLRRMLKSFSGISNRGPSQSVFTAPRGCEYLYSVPRLPCRVECLWEAHKCMRNPIVLQRSQKRSQILSVLWYGLYLYHHLLLKENACSARYLLLL